MKHAPNSLAQKRLYAGFMNQKPHIPCSTFEFQLLEIVLTKKNFKLDTSTSFKMRCYQFAKDVSVLKITKLFIHNDNLIVRNSMSTKFQALLNRVRRLTSFNLNHVTVHMAIIRASCSFNWRTIASGKSVPTCSSKNFVVSAMSSTQ